MAETPEIKEGYSLDFYHVRWKPYKPDGKRQMKRAGRWQRMNDYGGYENCDAPGRLLQEPVDLEKMLAAPDLYAALNALFIAVCEANSVDPNMIYEGRDGPVSKAKSALSKARGETNG